MKKKRTAAMTAAVLAALCLLNGCASGTEEVPDPTEIVTGTPVQPETEPPIEIEADNWPDLLESVYAELDLETRPWVRAASVPEGDPAFQRMIPGLSTLSQPDEWVMLAEVPEKEIVLYQHHYNNMKVYLRYGKHFQEFEQDISLLDMVPEAVETEWEGEYALSVFYRHHAGNGGITGETAVYSWDGTSWTAHPFPPDEIREDPERPDVSSLRLAAELPEKDTAVYSDPQSGKSWLRTGEQFQEIPDLLTDGAELHYGDFDQDYDGEEELAVLSGRTEDNRYTRLSFYLWNGQCWTGTRHIHDGITEIDSRYHPGDIFQFYEDGTAYVMYDGMTMLLDLSSLCRDWETEPTQAFLDNSQARYTYQNGTILVIFPGYIAGHNDTPVFSHTSEVGYHEWYGFRARLDSPYDITPEFQPEQLSSAQKEVLRRYVKECEEKKDSWDALFQGDLALFDFDGDGQLELFLESNLKRLADSYYGLSIFRTDGRRMRWVPGGSRFYDNGILWEPWSHNQGVNCAIWPFTLHRWQGASYGEIGGARARDSRAPGEFPAEADLDGDGMVFLMGGNALTEEGYVDNAVFDEWWDSYVGGARLLPVCYFPLTEDLIDNLE
ncbi:MAG: hypothetical protein K2O18_19220 [Oscillospiraceae bacterium]|nr:hypothetical protein [Oscillospiraceae bacterium]